MSDLEQSAEDLFSEALDLPAERRVAFLDAMCSKTSELRRLVDALLHDHERAGNFLAQPLLRGGDLSASTQIGLPDAPGRVRPAQLIAQRFLVVRFIARGGMGEVYEVRDQLENASIALKIIRPEIAADAASTARFEQEVLPATVLRGIAEGAPRRVANLFASEVDATELAQRVMLVITFNYC